ncbi:ammonia-dependent NAD(+) synthetase [Rhodococcus fascians]|uniref:ammonia-dependent NAD(+) synthetase n=1 Tax=Rhodococcoides fascians TaxID=1828 RepID=UPI001427D836|nr:ammonia-dependent NAD(+) synthetase [Rhodococcus fascians]MBM7241935.1 ammonia-dependent NAD(+) synthetase [Rhodococcus fascians]MBX5331061.1 ammonia-dependent NAD(+) synthetase [Rhodococcus fascians]MBY3808639.1 ammonia-dependent NAD(+) synthetase [Rhodococcus fascians]MBY3840083.1 ammonia-dependent NAD(+) synthetase [Rhodococcus fascians]MBY3845152.1 ammonia-dependent NAD(+) synthetase [Rhodococcus fascians]
MSTDCTVRSRIQKELGVRPSIDPEQEIRRRVAFLTDYLRASGTTGFVLGISGGQDSTLAGKLAQLAVREAAQLGTRARFVAVRLPYGTQADESDAVVALDFIEPDRTVTVDIRDAVDASARAAATALGVSRIDDFVRGNIKARERMIAQYTIAGQENLLVIGTDHAAEAVTGFFTKYGDGGADVTPLSGLTKSQGAQLLRHLDAPESTWRKVPTADLEDDRPALPDEQALGVTYAQIDAYLQGGPVEDDAVRTIERWYDRTRHKRTVPVGPDDRWWRTAVDDGMSSTAIHSGQ